jgi:phage major head subunit gpT-like protein
LPGKGFDTKCYDGQNFFDTDHAYMNEDGTETGVSNMQAGTGTPWGRMDTSRPVKPMVFQERLPYEFQRRDGACDSTVFDLDAYRYGIRARVNAGFGLWQLVLRSKADLTATNYAQARSNAGHAP